MEFLTVRKKPGFDRLDGAVLAVYAGVLAWAIEHYLPFVDEAQAWLIVRDCSLREVLLRRMHYEGAPGLWPTILWVACRLHLPYAGLNWLGGCFALLGIYILLRFSPFPRIIRWLLPFTFFLQYQYAVVARPYVMFPALLFALCFLFTREKPRPILFGLIAGLLANVAMHAAFLACAFGSLYLYEIAPLRSQWPERVARRRVVAGACLFLAMLACSAAVAFPAADAVTSLQPNTSIVKPNALLLKLVPEERLPASAPPLDPPLYEKGQSADSGHYTPFWVRVGAMVVMGANAALFPIAKSNILALCFLGCFGLWLRSRGCLRLMLPFWASIVLSVQVVIYDHHTGMFLLSLVAAAWIALCITPADGSPHGRRIEKSLVAISLVVIALQIGWSIHCLYGIAYAPADAGKETEAFLATNFAGKRIAGFGFESTSVEAYSPNKLYFNQSRPFWIWGLNVLATRRRTEALAQRPDVVVVNDFISERDTVQNQLFTVTPVGMHFGLSMVEFWQQNGYHVTHRFCGSRFARGGLNCISCEVILEPNNQPTEASSPPQSHP